MFYVDACVTLNQAVTIPLLLFQVRKGHHPISMHVQKGRVVAYKRVPCPCTASATILYTKMLP